MTTATKIGATVELTPHGFIVEDDFGPEGRRPCMGGMGPNGPGTLVFFGRIWAQRYAEARNRHREHFEREGYAGQEYELREACKQIARDHARILDL